jgi:hypothetical protein
MNFIVLKGVGKKLLSQKELSAEWLGIVTDTEMLKYLH